MSTRQHWQGGSCREVQGRTPAMNGYGKSDRSVLPGKPANKVGNSAAEQVEGRDLTKGNPRQLNTSRAQSRVSVQSALERIRQAAVKDKELRFTSLMHHIYNPDTLRAAYLSLKKAAAAGVVTLICAPC